MQIKRLTNDKPLWDSFCEEIDNRIKFCYKQLEQRNEALELYRLQGEIKALQSLKQLRDKFNNSNPETF
jgi:RNAse (barnase) inhibitor barstar